MQNRVDVYPRSRFQQDICQHESLELHNITKKLYEESLRSSRDIHHSEYHDVPQWLKSQTPIMSEASMIALPQPEQEGLPLQTTLQERTSTRFFAPTPITLTQLATMLKLANEGDQQDWAGEKDAGSELQFIVVAWRVKDIAPAIYQYESASHALFHIHAIPDQPIEAKDLVLQVEFAYAPMIILITGNLAAASARHGAWGHRQLLLRAGTAGQRLWFASLGQGLVGTVFAGFLQPAARTYAHLNGYTRAGLLAYATGFPINNTFDDIKHNIP